MWVVENIHQCLTMVEHSSGGKLGVIEDAAIAGDNELIQWVGPRKKIPATYRDAKKIDANRSVVTPGLVDCHTHLLFAGSRADEFFERLQGKSYEEIARQGGGINKTVRLTREATDKALLKGATERLNQFLRFGVTTVEIKSGYGLSAEQEMRLLKLTRNIRSTVDIVPTFLGAHVVPTEFQSKREAYVRIICEEMLPQVAKAKLSKICDVFSDDVAFSTEETRRIFTKAKELGFDVKLHADQLTDQGGAKLAAEFKALSADHLEHISETGIQALAKSGTVGVLLPGATFFLGKKDYPPARRLLDAGVKIAISTDCNPGTSMTENLPFIMTLAAIELKMTADEIWKAVTRNAALALGSMDRGEIRPGALADLVFWNVDDYIDVPYQFGSIFPAKVLKRGVEATCV